MCATISARGSVFNLSPLSHNSPGWAIKYLKCCLSNQTTQIICAKIKRLTIRMKTMPIKATEVKSKAEHDKKSTLDKVHPNSDAPMTEEKLSILRKTIARRLTESKTTVPHFYSTIEVELDNLLAHRKNLNAKVADKGMRISVNDYVIRAVGLSLMKVPSANVQFAGNSIYRYSRADVSVAVAIEGGLITPVIRGACSRGLEDISTDMANLASRAKAGKLLPQEYMGGTFSISNLGMFGINEFSAIINSPQAAILAVGAGLKQAVVKDDSVEISTVMKCTLSCDHRVVDGAVAAEFLGVFRDYIENPDNLT